MAVLATAVSGVQKAAKAIYAAVAQLIAGMVLVTIDGGSLADVSTNEWFVIAGAVLAAGGGVYGLSNKTS